MNRRYENFNKTKRLELAAVKVLDEAWTQGRAADEFGVSRQRVNIYVKKLREEREGVDDEPDLGDRIIAQAGSPEGLNERRRVGSFEEFDQRYFGRWVCPDCEKHHETPDFHREIIEAVEGPEKRVLVNVPPYHAKSTLVTVKQSIHNLVKNPNSRRIIVSKSLPFARTFLHSIDQLLTNPDLYLDGPSLLEDWGPFKDDNNKSQIWNKDQIYVSGRQTAEKDPTIQVIGIGGQIYGRRCDDIVFDDIADEKNQANPEQVDKMREWIDKMALSRIGRNGKARWVGTRVKAGDIYSVLRMRSGYKVITYSCIREEYEEDGEPAGTTLWPDHFPYDAAVERRLEMKPAEWQLVYQNVDIPGEGASFTEEMTDAAKDLERMAGQFDPHWRQVFGLDLAGAGADSGYTAGIIKGVDLATGKRFMIDLFKDRAMKAPRLKDQILHWADTYPLYELRVESNGLQSQIVQYNEEIIRELALRGIRVVPHITSGNAGVNAKTAVNKWDTQFGVESTAPLYNAGLISIPWGNRHAAAKFEPYIQQLLGFPMAQVSDLVMADWFAELGIKDLLKRANLPLFDERKHIPNRLKRKRVIVDFGERRVKPVRMEDQVAHRGATMLSGARRRTIGHISRHGEEPEEAPEPRELVNVGPSEPAVGGEVGQ